MIIHDLNRIKSNLDHVLIGLAGVFVLDTENLSGAVEAVGDQLRITRPDESRLTAATISPSRPVPKVSN
ncbi:MAG: NERD domain-containing protein [Actinomycetota bacterium]|nr:NERD domain-containing protein [Actinomycetota bacterium]